MIYLGIILFLVGLNLRIFAVHELQKFNQWSNVPKLPTQIVTTGIYRFINHPAYYGSLLIFLGAFLLIPTDWRFLVEMVLLNAIFQNRIEFENYLKTKV